jgi:ribose transport system substrate-binding protein
MTQHIPGVKRFVALAALAVTATLVFTGCTTDSSGASATIASSDLGFLSQAQYDDISAQLTAAAANPTIVAPSDPIDVSKLAGKKVLVMPVASFLTDCDIISKDVVDTVEKMGMTGTYFQTDGSTGSYVAGMQQAISQNYDLVLFVCGVDPNLISTQIQEATAAGIKVVSGSLYDNVVDARINPLLSAQTNSPYASSLASTALQAIMDNRDAPFGVLLITADENASTAGMNKLTTETYQKYCPKCTLTTVNVPIADAATKMTPTVQAALIADPTIKVVVPFFGGTYTTNAVAALTSVNRTGVGIYGSYGMPIADIQQMTSPTNKLEAVTRHNNLLRMVTSLDAGLRALAGMPAQDANKYVDPNRLVTPANAAAFLQESNEGFGMDGVNAYYKLWGYTP